MSKVVFLPAILLFLVAGAATAAEAPITATDLAAIFAPPPACATLSGGGPSMLRPVAPSLAPFPMVPETTMVCGSCSVSTCRGLNAGVPCPPIRNGLFCTAGSMCSTGGYSCVCDPN